MNYEVILNKISKSKFRSSFHLRKYMIDYIDKLGMETIRCHAYDLITSRIKTYNKDNDGRQTPMKNHPVFIAMHACGACCRGCLEKWYSIPKERNLTDSEINHLVNIVCLWIEKEYKSIDK